MATTVTYEDFRDVCGGELGADAFASALPAALREVRWLCGGFEPDATTEPSVAAAWMRAVCVAAGAFGEWGEGQTGGFRLGEFSVTHYDNRGTTGTELAREAALRELSGTGLEFAGAGR